MRLVKDVFMQFDEVCRSIFKAAEHEAKKQAAPVSKLHCELDPIESPEDNNYASHVARGMAKIRANG